MPGLSLSWSSMSASSANLSLNLSLCVVVVVVVYVRVHEGRQRSVLSLPGHHALCSLRQDLSMSVPNFLRFNFNIFNHMYMWACTYVYI